MKITTSLTITQTQRYKAAIEGAGITDWLNVSDADLTPNEGCAKPKCVES